MLPSLPLPPQGDHSLTQRTKNLLSRGKSSMDFQVPKWAPKACWIVHFTLTSWSMLSPFITAETYIYSQVVFLTLGLWLILDGDSVDAAFLFFFTILITILNDVVVLSIYTPRGYSTIEDDTHADQEQRNSFRFALIMAIANLMLKPFTAFLVLKKYQDSGGEFIWSTNTANSSDTNGVRSDSSYGAVDSSRGYQNLDSDRLAKDPKTQSERQHRDLHDDPRDIHPKLLTRNNREGSECS
ncbi:hypothetical protein EGW08_009229 [Elysia chlorotica]|uniref:Uncharacterized protein n=1 Tax=Elysia chlorotica TaxID=188477 RepID=A0A433TN34_ELYCH|nr:hypothetical protein EGW08_009229 [Elysia chlorotica]